MKGYVLKNDDGSISGTFKASTADVTALAPTASELTGAFGSPATVGAGFIGVINDAGLGLAGILVWSDGTNWLYTLGVKAL